MRPVLRVPRTRLGDAARRTRGRSRAAIVLDAATRLDRPIDSHLNSFCDVEVRGHRRLFLEFSPCPGHRIEVRPFDYPFGRPARFAFVEADRTFRVVEASNSEKGPFHTLARGRLEPEQALTITFHDEERAVARLSLDDYAAQADTTLSPTAGWGGRSMPSSSACRRTPPRPRHRHRSSSRWRRRRSAAAGIASATGWGPTATDSAGAHRGRIRERLRGNAEGIPDSGFEIPDSKTKNLVIKRVQICNL